MKQDHDITSSSFSQSLGRYQVLRRIGKGGMGDVWLAEDPSLHRQVAIKTLPTHSQNDHEFSLRFAQEAQAAAALNHPHILSIHDFGEQPLSNGQSTTYIVMPYISGGSLADKIIANNTSMPVQVALQYLQQAAEAIDYAHSQGVVHRDIKPGNMLLRSDNWLLLADFGIARMLSSQEQMTLVGAGIGTPEYMAPEQARGKAEAASDNYSLAVIAYQLFTGYLPFTAETGYAITVQHLITPPPSPREYNPNLSPAFEMALLQGLAKEPQQRPSSACTFIAELQHAFAGAAFEPTYMKPMLPATLVVPMSTPDGRGIQPETSHNNDVTKVQEKQAGVTRRQMLIGGGAAAAVLAAGSVGIWDFALHNTTSQNTNRTPSTGNTPIATPGPYDPVLIIQAHVTPASSLRWSPTANNILASAGTSDDHQMFLWDINTLLQQKGQIRQAKDSTKMKRFDTPFGLLLAWSPDGNSLVVGNTNTNPVSSNTESTAFTVFKSDGSTFASGYEKPVTVPGISIRALGWFQKKYIVAIVTTAESTQLALWDTTQPTLRFTPTSLSDELPQAGPSATNEQQFSVSPDGSLLAFSLTNGVRVGSASVSGTKVLWQPHRDVLQFTTNGQTYQADGLSWTPDSTKVLAISTYDLPSEVKECDVQKPKQFSSIWRVPNSDVSLTTLTRSPKVGSTFLASSSKTGSMYLWDLGKGGLPAFTLKGLNAGVTALAWSRDGQWLAASYDDTYASILIWKTGGLH